MKKLGFTLAEVLISLALVGVVSSLTVPTLVSAHQRNVQGAALATAVSDFETAMRSMMAAEDATELTDTRAWRRVANNLSSSTSENNIRSFVGDISDYIEIQSFDRSVANFYRGQTVRDINRNSIGANNWAMTGKVVFSSNKNTVYMIGTGNAENRVITAAQALDNGINLRRRVAFITIDTNGSQPPNMFGRDIFYFNLGDDGVLYPFGGRDVSFMVNQNVTSTWDNASSDYACTDAVKARLGVGCTARLIESGYKMDY
ncbi:MAG: type II secretion system GspH family protein [Candidatus Gastranaerophilales bacterium]|nr:type II secretion system GspH family protein [Candidatus Gastranaerophilales bacterium]MCM1073956.1 type II secretion system GspH family protein [Bacteroides sp.]